MTRLQYETALVTGERQSLTANIAGLVQVPAFSPNLSVTHWRRRHAEERTVSESGADRLPSLEQPRSATVITSSKGWIAHTDRARTATAIVWRRRSASRERQRTGMLLKSGGVLEIVAPGLGRVAASRSVSAIRCTKGRSLRASISRRSPIVQTGASALDAKRIATRRVNNHRDSLPKVRVLEQQRSVDEGAIASDTRSAFCTTRSRRRTSW